MRAEAFLRVDEELKSIRALDQSVVICEEGERSFIILRSWVQLLTEARKLI